MTEQDVQKMVADALSKATAEKRDESIEAAREANGKAVRTPADLSPDVIAAMKRAGEPVRPTSDKGLDFARFVLASMAAADQRKSVMSIAKERNYSGVVKALSEGSFADGGSLVPDVLSSEFIEYLRPSMVCLALGARQVEFKGSLSFGRQNATATASWMGEASNITGSSPTTGQLQLQAKKLGALVPISNDLFRNPSAGVEALVRDDLVKVMGNKLDLTMLEGSGSAYTPRGVDNWVASANSNGIGGTTLAFKVADLGSTIRLVESTDVQISRGGWVMHPRTKWALMTTLDSNGHFVFADEMSRGMLFGYPFKTKSDLTASSSNYKIYFGEWPELILGVDTGMQIETLLNAAYYNGSSVTAGTSTDESVVRAIGRYDVIMRHTGSFAQLTSVSY